MTINEDTSVMSQIDEKKDGIDFCHRRINQIERTLRLSKTPDSERDSLLQELDSMRKDLQTQEMALKHLHMRNRKTSVFVVVSLASLFVFYFCLWSVYNYLFPD